jgi:hypothetical protein
MQSCKNILKSIFSVTDSEANTPVFVVRKQDFTIKHFIYYHIAFPQLFDKHKKAFSIANSSMLLNLEVIDEEIKLYNIGNSLQQPLSLRRATY